MKSKLNFFSIFLLGLTTLLACTKTEIVPYEQEPSKLIRSYKIVNTSTELNGIINEKEKTITVTIPYGQYYTTLEPEITLQTGNTLQADADTLITNVYDYFVKGREILYPVTDAQGNKNTFKLLIKTLQPPLEFEEISPSATNHKVFDMSNWRNVNLSHQLFNLNQNYPYSDNADLNREVCDIFIVNKDGFEIPFDKSTSTPWNGSINLNFRGITGYVVPGSSPPVYTSTPTSGLYTVKIRFYSKETTLKNQIRIINNRP